jgi:Coenzyme PQQ synthesis protein D (PqqD)
MFYTRSNQVKVKKVGNNTALYVSDQKGIHVLNETALFIWEALQDPFTFEELLYMLRETFEGDATQMKEDLDEILDIFLRHDLVCREK